MCGIVGAFGAPDLAEARSWAESARDRLRHRGPDDAGLHVSDEGRAVLGFRRLSILDLSAAGHQPMTNEEGSVWLAFNGEIYNHEELRRDLRSRGHRFRSRSDAEVLVHLWEERGPELVHALNGMFAFAIWDERDRTGFLARDHVGIKPLYLARRDGGLWFGSEAKALTTVPGYRAGVDAGALIQYLTFLWVPPPRTVFEGIGELPPGHRLVWRDGGERVDRWWDWDQTPDDGPSAEEWALRLRLAVGDAVERQLQSDVPLGAFLSGGLDTSAVVGAMAERRPDESIRCYTMVSPGFEGFEDDLPYARRVASRHGIDLREHQAATDLVTDWPGLIWHTDEPLADPAVINTWKIASHAREEGTIVLLSGQGGDELFHGYRSHRVVRLGERTRWLPSPGLSTLARFGEGLAGAVGAAPDARVRRAVKLLRAMGARGADRALILADWASPEERARVLSPDTLEAGREARPFAAYRELYEGSTGATEADRWSYVLLNTFLPALNLTYGDKAGMAASVEIRVPLLDREVVELAGRIPARYKSREGQSKWILGEAADPWLPAGIRERSKTGFGAPVRAWLRGPLLEEVRSTVTSDRLAERGLFRSDGLARLVDDLERGRRDVAYLVWALYTFEHWARAFLDGEGVGPRGPLQTAGAGVGLRP